MGRSKQTGIYPEEGGYAVDARCCGQRIRRRGFLDYEKAHRYLTHQRETIRAQYQIGQRPDKTLEEGATRFLREKQAANMPSAETDAYLLSPLVKMLGSLILRDVSNETLEPFVGARRAEGMKNKTINNALGAVNRICVLAATKWKLPNGLTWLASAPKVDLLPLDDQRPPRPITWAEQGKLLAELPRHLKDMSLFVLNTGLRENVACQLRWEWEVPVTVRPGLTVSVFVVPRLYVKGRKRERLIICNRVAQGIIDAQRGHHPERVFTWYHQTKPGSNTIPKRKPVGSMNNTAWQNARTRAGLGDLHVHDLRHTVGMRLRHAGISERTQDEILWHNRKDMTSHYAIAQVREVYDALEAIKKEGEEGETLNLLALVRRQQLQAITQNSPTQRKTA
jgi:integrase